MTMNNPLNELSVAWTREPTADRIAYECPVENPLPKFEMTWKSVQKERQHVMAKCGLSWAELLAEAAKRNPELTEMVCTLADQLDSNIYGRYVDGVLTQEELDQYYQKLDEWRRVSLEMFRFLGEGGDHA
jgi:hypothetical protein